MNYFMSFTPFTQHFNSATHDIRVSRDNHSGMLNVTVYTNIDNNVAS